MLTGGPMTIKNSSNDPDDQERVPFLQKVADSPFWLLILGMFVMVLFYTGWGIWEILKLPQATLP